MKRDANDMVRYLTDCTMATVVDMAMKKTRPKGEYERQKLIAQKGVDFMRDNHIPADGSRVENLQPGQSVADWAKQFEEG